MDINKLNLFDKVQIQDNSNWNGRICIVDWKEKDMIGLSNLQDPQHQYIVGIWNANNIIPFN